MSGAFGKCSPTRLLRLLGLNPSGEDDQVSDQFLILLDPNDREVALANTLCLSLLFPNDREVALAKSLEARSPVSGAVPNYYATLPKLWNRIARQHAILC